MALKKYIHPEETTQEILRTGAAFG